MAVDIVKLRALLDQLEVESAEAVTAKESLTAAQEAANTAAATAQTASDEYIRESEESKAKMAEIIAELQAAIQE
jgi:hypothetical protein